jgi:hypothetical protein
MPTAQARLIGTRGLHAARSSIRRSDNDTSSLPERRIACRFLLFRWHRAHTCHPLTFPSQVTQVSDLLTDSPGRLAPSPRRVLPARPIMGTCAARPGSRWARLPHTGLAGNRALCAFLLCKSCFLRDIDLCAERKILDIQLKLNYSNIAGTPHRSMQGLREQMPRRLEERLQDRTH